MPDVTVQDASPNGGGINRRTLLIGALVIGGGIGLIVFLMRKSTQNTANGATNQVTDSVPTAGALDIAYQNLASQLLGFRGDVSVSNAKLVDAIDASTSTAQQGSADVLSAVGDESAARAKSDSTLLAMLTNWFASSGQQLSSIRTTQQWQSQYALDTAGRAEVINNRQEQLLSGLRGQLIAQQGAGGATLRDAVIAAWDGGMGDASEGLARLSAGPVRVVSRVA